MRSYDDVAESVREAGVSASSRSVGQHSGSGTDRISLVRQQLISLAAQMSRDADDLIDPRMRSLFAGTSRVLSSLEAAIGEATQAPPSSRTTSEAVTGDRRSSGEVPSA